MVKSASDESTRKRSFNRSITCLTGGSGDSVAALECERKRIAPKATMLGRALNKAELKRLVVHPRKQRGSCDFCIDFHAFKVVIDAIDN
jgi:hypothetical protein